MIFHFNFSIGIYIYGTVILFLLYWRIRSAIKIEPLSNFSRLFGKLVIFSAISMLIYSLFFVFFAGNSYYLWIGNTLGEPFFLIGFVYAISISFLIIKPEIPSSKIVIPLSALAVFLSVFLHLKYPFLPTFDEYGFLHWNASFLPGLNYSIFSFLGLFPLSVILLVNGIRDKSLRARYLSLFSAMILFVIGGAVISLANSKSLYIFASLTNSLGFTFLLFAYLSCRKKGIGI